MAEMFAVQQGVPVPAIDRTPKNRRKYPIVGMAVGDMFFVPGRPAKLVSAYISRISRDLPGKFTARHCWMWLTPNNTWQLLEPGEETQVAGATEGTGVWRLE